MTFEETMALVLDTMQTERKSIIQDIEAMKTGDLYDSFGCGYDNALDDIIDMITAKNEEK